jgi:opacity protein-like surface antigen
VDGYLDEERPATDQELEALKSTVNKYKQENQLYKAKAKELEKVTNEAEKIGENAEDKINAQVEAKKAENRAMEKIKKAEAKLKCLMDGNTKEECSQFNTEEQTVSVVQASPVPVSTVETSVSLNNPFEVIKLLPYAGATTFNGKVEQLETELSAGLRLESNITTRFSMGIGAKFDQMKTNDFANNSLYMNQGYNNFFGPEGRQIQYRSMGLDIYGKFFITGGERFRPYVGAGLAYNRATLKYNDTNPYYDEMNSYYYGTEEYNTTFLSGQLMLGTEIMITKSIGLNLEGAYSTGLGENLSSKAARNGVNSPDQTRLRDLGDEIINSNALSMFLSALFIF